MLSLEDEALISIILANNRRIDEILKKQALGVSHTAAPATTPSPPPPPPPPKPTTQPQREASVPRIEFPQLDINPNAIVDIITNDSMADDMPTLDLSCGSDGTDNMSISAGSTPPPPPPPQSNVIVDHTLLPPPEETVLAPVPVPEPVVQYSMSSIPGLGADSYQHSLIICDSQELDYYESQESDCGGQNEVRAMLEEAPYFAERATDGGIQNEEASQDQPTLPEQVTQFRASIEQIIRMRAMESLKARGSDLQSITETINPATIEPATIVPVTFQKCLVESLVQREAVVADPVAIAKTAIAVTDSIPESGGALPDSNIVPQPISDELTVALKQTTPSIVDKATLPIQLAGATAKTTSGSTVGEAKEPQLAAPSKNLGRKKVIKVRVKKGSSDNEVKGSRTVLIGSKPVPLSTTVPTSAPVPTPTVADVAAEKSAHPPAVQDIIVSEVEDKQEGVTSDVTTPAEGSIAKSETPEDTPVIPEKRSHGSDSGSDFGSDFVVVDDFNNTSSCQGPTTGSQEPMPSSQEPSTSSQELKSSQEPALSGSQDTPTSQDPQLPTASPAKKKKGKRKIARRKPKLPKKVGIVASSVMTDTKSRLSETLKKCNDTLTELSQNSTVKPSIRAHLSTHVDSSLITDLRCQLERKGQQSTSGKQKAVRPLQEQLSLPSPPDALSNRPYTRSNSRSPDRTTRSRSPLIRTVAGIKRQTSPLLAGPVRPAKVVCPEVFHTPEKLNAGRVLLETPPIPKLALRPEELSIVCWEHCPTKQKYPRTEEAFIVHLNKDHTNPNIVFSLPKNQIVCVCVKCETVVKYTRFSKDKHVKEKHQNTDVTVFYIYIEDAGDGDFGITHLNAPMQKFGKVGYFESFTTDAALDTVVWQDVRGLSFCYHYCALCHRFVQDSFAEVESHVKSRQHTSKITWKL